MTKDLSPEIEILFRKHFQEEVLSFSPVGSHGSSRVYLRLKGAKHSCLAAFNSNQKENRAFVAFSKHFRTKGIPVPEIYAEDLEHNIYLLEDLGDLTLHHWLQEKKKDDSLSDELLFSSYQKILAELAKIQVLGAEGLDFSLCYPVEEFSTQSFFWDFNYFKYCFLKLLDIPFDEVSLEKDFHTLADLLSKAECTHFLFRDFQSRNIMIKEDTFFFIDYQGGRKGALQYDVATLLFEPSADLSFQMRERLLESYLDSLSAYIPVDRSLFKQYYYAYVYLRRMQAMGTYGLRGLYENKALFIQRIPLLQKTLRWMLAHAPLPVQLPELFRIFQKIVEYPIPTYSASEKQLTLTLYSFSYRKRIPQDYSGNGGGFVFDCRSLPNPGREERFHFSTGKDADVIAFFRGNTAMERFLQETESLISQTISVYKQRDFKHLFVAFGCTGGQHRSVYCAEQIALRLSKKFDIRIELTHREQAK